MPAHNSKEPAKRGLWADSKPVPPWEWRQKQREKEKQARPGADTGYWLNTTKIYTQVLGSKCLTDNSLRR